jgi:hypothetical protein
MEKIFTDFFKDFESEVGTMVWLNIECALKKE